jgi:hypothetical protein
MRKLDKRARVTRRRFLATGSGTALAVGALAAADIVIDPSGAWAQAMKTLPPETARTLLQMARDLYPHDRVGDDAYARAVEPYDKAAATDAKLKDLIVKGVEALDAAANTIAKKPYVAVAAEAERVKALKAIEKTPFFAKVRGDLIVSLYNQKEVWAKLGYEGPSAPQGGYLNRGFNDLNWLKDA